MQNAHKMVSMFRKTACPSCKQKLLIEFNVENESFALFTPVFDELVTLVNKKEVSVEKVSKGGGTKGKRNKIDPEVKKRILELISEGMKPMDIHRETGVNVLSIYTMKKKFSGVVMPKKEPVAVSGFNGGAKRDDLFTSPEPRGVYDQVKVYQEQGRGIDAIPNEIGIPEIELKRMFNSFNYDEYVANR